MISTGRVKDGASVRGRPPGVHTGTRGRLPLHDTRSHTISALDEPSSLHYKVCLFILVCNRLKMFVEIHRQLIVEPTTMWLQVQWPTVVPLVLLNAVMQLHLLLIGCISNSVFLALGLCFILNIIFRTYCSLGICCSSITFYRTDTFYVMRHHLWLLLYCFFCLIVYVDIYCDQCCSVMKWKYFRYK